MRGPNDWKWMVAILTIVPSLLLSIWIWLLPSDEACSISVREAVASPDGSRVAVIYDERCGQSSIVNAKVAIAESVDDFSDRRPAPFFDVLLDAAVPKVTWSDDGHVIVELSQATRAFTVKQSSQGVDIEYRQPLAKM